MLISMSLQARKQIKKLPQNRVELVVQALRELERNPYLGDPKTGDLAGFLTYRFRVFNELWLIGYSFLDENRILIHKIGPRENFYKGV